MVHRASNLEDIDTLAAIQSIDLNISEKASNTSKFGCSFTGPYFILVEVLAC